MRRRDRKRIIALSMAAALMMSQFATTGGTHVYAQEESAQSQDSMGLKLGLKKQQRQKKEMPKQ